PPAHVPRDRGAAASPHSLARVNSLDPQVYAAHPAVYPADSFARPIYLTRSGWRTHPMQGCLRGLRGWAGIFGILATTLASAQGTRETTTYRRIKAALDAIPAIDTHDHLWPFDRLPGYVETPGGKGMNLAGLWRNSYFPGVHRLTAWTPGMSFDAWWAR